MASSGGKRNYKVLEYDDEQQGLAPMAVGSEVGKPKVGHSTGCVVCSVVLTLLLCLLVLGGTSTQTDLLAQIGVCEPVEDICESAACVELASELLGNMNTSVDPCVDFYEYTCGGWMEKNPLPDDKTRISTFDQLADAGKAILKRELESGFGTGTVQKAVRYYAACMDTDTIEDAGVGPLADLLDDLGLSLAQLPLDTETAVPATLARLHGTGSPALFNLYVSGDDHDSTNNAVFVGQSGLSLPSRDYYIGKDIDTDPILQALVNHIANANHLLDSDAVPTAAAYRQRAEAIVAFESALAEAMLSRVAQRDPEATYNDMTTTMLESLTPHFSWAVYLRALLPVEASAVDRVIVQSPDYLSQMDELINSVGLNVVSDYLRWQAINSALPHLASEFADEAFVFQSAVFGLPSQPPRWETCVARTDSALGFAVSKLYVDAAFGGDAKAAADTMIEAIRNSFEEGLPELDWMDSATQEQARLKAEAVSTKIGFPDFIMDPEALASYYAAVPVDDRYFANRLASNTAETRRNLIKIGTSVDRSEWGMTASTVNAYYQPTANEIVFPAAILQPTFFHADYIQGFNFGGIGVVIGHELTHGFDDSGSQYDAVGNLVSWWTPDVRAAFEQKAQCLVDEYSGFTVNGEHENGALTLGENMADNGGLHVSFRAYNNWLEENNGGIAEPRLPGLQELSAKQLFFVSFATVWCESRRPESAHQQLLTDPHSPGRYRVIGTLENSDDFAREFNCPAGSPMNPVEKCGVW